MSQSLQIRITPATHDAFVQCYAFNRYRVIRIGEMVLIVTALVDQDEMVRSSFSVTLSPRTFESNFESIVRYVDDNRSRIEGSESPRNPVKLPNGGISIPHANMLSAGIRGTGDEAEISFESLAYTVVTRQTSSSGAEDGLEVAACPIALLRSPIQVHFHLLNEIYFDEANV